MKIFRRGLSGLILFSCVLYLSGCWDIVPIEDRALVLVVGLDKNGNRVRLSAQVPTIKNLIQTPSSFTDRRKPMAKPFVVESASLLNGIQQLEDRIYQSMIVGAVKIIIVSLRTAEDDLMEILTVFLRQPSVSFQTLVLCAENSAEEIIRFESPFDIQPGLMISKQQQSSMKMAHSFPMRLGDFIARVDNQTIDPYLPVIKLDTENKSYILEGIKVFNKGRVVGALSPGESYFFGVITGQVTEGYQEITVKGKRTGFSKVSYHPKIRIRRFHGHSSIFLEINTQGTLLQIPGGFPNRVETYRLIKREMERQLKKRVLSVVDKLQSLNADPVGFQKYMEIAGIKNWDEAYPVIPVEIKVHFNFRNLSPAF
ncbi:MAG: Ger(x)C family spore germination protein [Bacillota bacterium]